MLRTLRVFAWVLGILLLLGISMLTTVDRSPVQDRSTYQSTLTRLDSSTWSSSNSTYWLGGWASVNVTPAQPAELVGYSPRGPYTFVQDSSHIKALSLSNGKSSIAWLNYELLIVHPYLAEQVRTGIKKAGIPLDQLIFTATHTHSGMGGYMPGPLGALAFGGYDENLVEYLVKGSLQALQTALATQDTVTIAYKKTNTTDLVSNRFTKGGPIDPFVRQMLLKRKDGKNATFLTYSAHATILSSKFMGLSGDYPAFLTQQLEQEFDFALFAAGTVGSHRPMAQGNRPEEVNAYAKAINATLSADTSEVALKGDALLRSSQLQINLGEPQLRISTGLRLRPWLFRYLLGEVPAYLDITQVGDILFISSSGELSGVFYEAWDKLAQEKGLHLVITVFNGSYVGYITPDELYDAQFHEVREMNWFGPGNGYYFDQLVQGIIHKAEN
ncbi:MAG: alkaline ceramidase [Bacteroidetes bacterium]|nr:alkaline ceramidase [Bacteroidota bacterium]